MAEYIVMPKLGFDMREGVLNNWLKQVGDTVTKGEVVAEIESDKATLELESQVSGVLLKLIEEPGAVVPIGANLAIVGQEGEDVSGMDGGAAGGADSGAKPSENGKEARTEEKPVQSQAETPAQATTGPAAQTLPTPKGTEEAETAESQRSPEPVAAEPSDEYPGGVKATPVARRIAREHEVDLLHVKGSGADGRIRKADVEAYLAAPSAAEPEAPAPATATVPEAAAAPVPAIAPTVGPDTTEVETSRLRRAIARRMTESTTTTPHFFVTAEVDMEPVLALRKQINASLPEEGKVTINDLIVKGAALALRDFPNLNASYAGEKMIRHNRINVGSAVAVEGGLLTVVQKDTDNSTISKIAADHKAMIQRAREGKVRPDDIEGSTFTVSNLGPFDVDNFIAIINPPEAAILAIGSAKQVPVVVDGELRVGTRMKVTISADHRVSDGAEAARYLQAFKAILEQPMRLLI
jgi:pyruvate dehydrogenase E2 component (dihydrolipoamide acetyltransferase)